MSRFISLLFILGVIVYAMAGMNEDTRTPVYVDQAPASPAYSYPTESQPQIKVWPASKADCHPSYSPCLRADASDYDCEGGRGNGPYYTGRVKVIGPDVFELDRDGDGWGCE